MNSVFYSVQRHGVGQTQIVKCSLRHVLSSVALDALGLSWSTRTYYDEKRIILIRRETVDKFCDKFAVCGDSVTRDPTILHLAQCSRVNETPAKPLRAAEEPFGHDDAKAAIKRAIKGLLPRMILRIRTLSWRPSNGRSPAGLPRN